MGWVMFLPKSSTESYRLPWPLKALERLSRLSMPSGPSRSFSISNFFLNSSDRPTSTSRLPVSPEMALPMSKFFRLLKSTPSNSG